MKVEFASQIFEKSSNVKFQEKSVQWEPSCSMRTDRHDEANSSFRNFANVPNMKPQCTNYTITYGFVRV